MPPKTPPRTRPRPKPRFGGAVLLAVGLAFLCYGIRGVAYSSELAGTAGTIRVFLCDQAWSGSRGGTRTVCDGTFRSADGRIVNVDAFLDDDTHHAMGELVPVSWAGGKDYYTARPANAFGWSALLLAGVCLLACAVPALWLGQAARRTADSRLARGAGHAARGAYWGAATCGAAGLISLVIRHA